MNWTIEVHLCCVGDGSKEVIVTDGDATADMVISLAQIGARFTYKGVRYFGERPMVDPIERKLIYYCEGYRDS